MKEHPILFSALMARAILAGTKTQTRRVIRPQPTQRREGGQWRWRNTAWCAGGALISDAAPVDTCPYGEPGDRLWVKETWTTRDFSLDDLRPSDVHKGAEIVYRATEDPPKTTWRSPIFMCRWMSRITCDIVDIRIERVQDITDAGARVEGVDDRQKFEELWDGINSQRGHPWADNPWVWVIDFRRVEEVEG